MAMKSIPKDKLFELIEKCKISDNDLLLGPENESITSNLESVKYGHDEARANIILELELYFMNVNKGN